MTKTNTKAALPKSSTCGTNPTQPSDSPHSSTGGQIKPKLTANWNYDLTAAPPYDEVTINRIIFGKPATWVEKTKHWLLTYSSCGQLIYTHWLWEEGRWNLYTKADPPVAWLEVGTSNG